MNPAIITQFANPDPNAAPLNITQLVQLLNTLVTSALQGSYIPYVISADTPGADDRDKAWIRLDSGGRPIATMIWYNAGASGLYDKWRRVYNGMLNEIRTFSGDPTDTTNWGTSGLGAVGSDYDGWHICNGQDGVLDLSDNFIVGANMSGTPFSGGEWKSLIEDGSTLKHIGGNNTITLDAAHTYLPALNITFPLRSAPGDTGDSSGHILGKDGAGSFVQSIAAGNTTPTAIDIVNPYVALGFIIFVGYT
jgi:hypothetical protein